MSEREQTAVRNVRSFAVYAAGKLPPHVVEDLRIVCELAAIATGTRSAETNEDLAQSAGCQSGPKGIAPNLPPSTD